MLGIIIINYIKYDKTIDCINSIFETVKSDYKIYLIDNASPNESYQKLSELFQNNEKVCLIKSEKNLGYARGNNLCLEKAKADGCDYVLISNNDIIFNDNAIELLLKSIQNFDYLLIEPFIKNIDGSTQICVKKNKPSFKEYMMYSTYIHNLVSGEKKKTYYKQLQPDKFSQVYWASGACFIADMKQFESIGFFDPATFLYFEEYIISEKAVKNNLKIGFNPQAQVIHYHGASTGGNANLFTRLENFKSECYMFSNYWKISKASLRFVRIIRCLEVLFTFTKEKKLKDALSFVKQSKVILKQTKEMY